MIKKAILLGLVLLVTGSAFAQDGPRLVRYGETIRGKITDMQPRAMFSFIGAAGDEVTLLAEPKSGDLDPVMALYAQAEGDPLAEDDDGGGETSARITYTLPADGTYIVLVSRFLFESGTGTGDFTLTLSAEGVETGGGLGEIGGGVDREGAAALGFNEPLIGTLETGQSVTYALDNPTGEAIMITVARGTGDLTLSLLVIDAEGEVIAQAGGQLAGLGLLLEAGAPRYWLTLGGEGSGEYLIMAQFAAQVDEMFAMGDVTPRAPITATQDGTPAATTEEPPETEIPAATPTPERLQATSTPRFTATRLPTSTPTLEPQPEISEAYLISGEVESLPVTESSTEFPADRDITLVFSLAEFPEPVEITVHFLNPDGVKVQEVVGTQPGGTQSLSAKLETGGVNLATGDWTINIYLNGLLAQSLTATVE